MSAWDYNEAFSRNRGLITVEDQEKLRHARVAIAGMGGVGASHALTLARSGVGNFTIADPDIYETGNFNRQVGAGVSTIGKNKADIMARMIKDINPEADVRIFNKGINNENIDLFLEGADLFVDGFDFFVFDIRRAVFMRAYEKGISAVSAGPFGFGTVGFIFSPKDMSFDEYFDVSEDMSYEEKIAAFLTGVLPTTLHRKYVDLSSLDMATHRGPSSIIGCEMASSVLCSQALGLLLGWETILPAPYYLAMDSYTGKMKRGRTCGGNKNPLQKIRRAIFTRLFVRQTKATAAANWKERLIDKILDWYLKPKT